jgi:hypothetical protein
MDSTLTNLTNLNKLLRDIDFARLAFPQDDCYDTSVLLWLLSKTAEDHNKAPYVRRPSVEDVTICNGLVAVHHAPAVGFSNSYLIPAEPSHGNLPLAVSYLVRWPEAYIQFKNLINTVYPYSDLRQANSSAGAFGSSSHSFANELGAMHVTIDDPIGTAQAFVHEMAHLKLRAMGIMVDRSDRFIVNSPEELFSSPIRKDKRRPMTAVFHAQFSFMHVTALDLKMLKYRPEGEDKTHILMLLARNVIRMQSGYELIDKQIKTDNEGRLFVSTFMEWSANIIEESIKFLADNGFEYA